MEVCYNNNSSILLGNWTSRPIAKSAHCKLGPLPSRPIQPWPITNSAHDYKIALVLIQRLIITVCGDGSVPLSHSGNVVTRIGIHTVYNGLTASSTAILL